MNQPFKGPDCDNGMEVPDYDNEIELPTFITERGDDSIPGLEKDEALTLLGQNRDVVIAQNDRVIVLSNLHKDFNFDYVNSRMALLPTLRQSSVDEEDSQSVDVDNFVKSNNHVTTAFVDLEPKAVEDIQCPSIAQQQSQVQEIIAIKNEPAAPSSRPKRPRAPKRRYSPHSDYSFVTSAASFNTTAKKSKKRGRPAKEIITKFPTVKDLKHLPRDQAKLLVCRIKNNEAARMYRIKTKSKLNAMENRSRH